MKKLVPALAVAILLGGGLLGAAPARAVVDPDVDTRLPISGGPPYGVGMLVDEGHGRVVIEAAGQLMTTDLAGNNTGNVPLSDLGYMALTPDQSELVIARGALGFTLVDPVTLVVDRTLAGPSGCVVLALAPSAGKVFFSYRCSSGGTTLGAVDLGSGQITPDLAVLDDYYSGRLLSVPGAPSTLVSLIEGTIKVFDTSGGAVPKATLRVEGRARTTQLHDVALTADGSQIVAAEGGDSVRVYSAADLAHVGDRYTRYPADDVEVRGDGVVAAVRDDHLLIFEPDSFAPSRTTVVEPTEDIISGGVAFGTKRIYVVLSNRTGTWLHVDFPGTPPGLTVSTSSAEYVAGSSAKVAVRLVGPTTNREVRLYTTPVGGVRTLVKKGVVDPSTGLLTAVVPRMSHSTTFTAYFAGDDQHGSAIARRAVTVRSTTTISTPSTSTIDGFHKLRASSAPVLTVAVAPTPIPKDEGCLKVVLQHYVHRKWYSAGTIECAKRSPATGKYLRKLSGFKPGELLRVEAVYRTDAETASYLGSKAGWYYILFT